MKKPYPIICHEPDQDWLWIEASYVPVDVQNANWLISVLLILTGLALFFQGSYWDLNHWKWWLGAMLACWLIAWAWSKIPALWRPVMSLWGRNPLFISICDDTLTIYRSGILGLLPGHKQILKLGSIESAGTDPHEKWIDEANPEFRHSFKPYIFCPPGKVDLAEDMNKTDADSLVLALQSHLRLAVQGKLFPVTPTAPLAVTATRGRKRRAKMTVDMYE